MKTVPIQFGLIGAGHIAQTYVQAFEQAERARLVAVADVRADAAQALAEAFGCRSYPAYEEMAANETLDAVVVCTPPVTHPDICLYFLERGVHVLCEKPFSIDLDSAKTMADAASEAGVLLTMASKFRYVEDVARARSMAESGIVGEIVMFENAFTACVDMTSRWNSDPAISGGGVLIDNGTHALDLMRYFLGPLSDVQVVEGKRIQGLPVEETVHIYGHSEAGVMGSIDLSWSINKNLETFINIYGSKGIISVGWNVSRFRVNTSKNWVVFGQGYNKVKAFHRQVDNFSGAICGTEKLRITIEDAIASVEAVDAAYQALAQSRWTPILPARKGANGRFKVVAAQA